MTPNEQGRFCNSCAKTVVDFSSMTDEQLIRYFVELNGKEVCGNIHPEQLQRTISSLPAPRKKIFRYWQYAVASLMLFLKMPQAKAQGFMSAKIKVAGTHKTLSGKKIFTPSLLKRIAVTDIEGLPIAGATVRFSSDDNLLITDSTGKIYLNKVNENEKLIITAVGFEEKSILVKDIEFATVKMDHDIRSLENVVVRSYGSPTRAQSMALGGMGYRTVTISSFKDTVLNITNFFSPSLAAYPNPVMRGNTISISLKVKQSGVYRFYIYDASGRLLMVQNHQVAEKTFVQPINIPSGWSRGIYFVAVAGEDGKNIGKTKIVVQ